MAVRLNEKMASTRTITVDWDGDRVDVRYRPNAVTPDLLEEVDAQSDDNLDSLRVLITAVVDWWDVQYDDGSTLPVTMETVGQVPMPFLRNVQTGIMEAQRPPEDAASAGG